MQFVNFPLKNIKECWLRNGMPCLHLKDVDVSARRCHFVGVYMGMNVGKKCLCFSKKKKIRDTEIHSHYQHVRF
jgi:hypothetical protein